MEQAILDWLKQPGVRRLINATSPGLICEDKRILNVLKNKPNLSLVDFIENTDARRGSRNWGEVSEKKFTLDLALFLIRNLGQAEGVAPVLKESSVHDIESYDRAIGLGMEGLKALYTQRHALWWNLADKNGKADLLMVRIGQHVGFSWPYRLRGIKLSEFRKTTPVQLLKMKGYGKVKLKMVLSALAWAALTQEPVAAPPPMSAWEAYRAANLTPIEKDIIMARYGEKGGRRSSTLADVGELYGGKTRERIRQIEARVVEKMRLLGLQDSVQAWLYANAESIWEELADSQGNLRGFGINERAPRRVSKDLAWAFRVAGITPYDVLTKVGEMIGKEWYRRTPATNQQANT